jgi:TetR/AcrR family transcriptional regulator
MGARPDPRPHQRPHHVAAGRRNTRGEILDVATDLFGQRGVEAVSLDVIAAEVGVTKQTLLYWFPSKDELTQDPLDRVEAVVKAVFRQAVKRPSLLGLAREASRLPAAAGDRFVDAVRPLVDRAVAYLGREMDAGRLRRSDPRMVAALCYATVTGIATEPEALRAVGWTPDLAELRRLRSSLLEFLRAALAPSA